MSKPRETEFEKDLSRKMPLVFLVVLLVGGGIGSWLIHYNATNAADQRFMRASDGVVLTIQNRFNYYVSAVRQSAAMFIASEEVTEKEFQAYSDSIGGLAAYPGMSAMGFARFSAGAKLKATVVNYKAFDERIKNLVGLDLMKEPGLQKAMLDAGGSGKGRLGATTEMFNPNLKMRQGFALFFPVYEKGTELKTQADRLNSLKGFAFAFFNTSHLFSSIFERNNNFQEALGVNIYLKETSGLRQIYSSSVLYGPRFHDAVKKRVLEFKTSGEEIIFSVFTLPNTESRYAPKIAYYIALLALLTAFLVFYVARRFSKAKAATERSETEMRKIARENALLAQAGEELGKSLSKQKTEEKLAEFFVNNFADFCVLDFTEEDGARQIIKASKSLNTSRAESRLKLTSLAGEFTTNENCLSKVRETENAVVKEETQEERFHSYISIPLSIRGRLYGVITLLSLEPRYDFKPQQHLLMHLAQVGAIFIENTQLLEQAELANRLKDEFLATVSHELRTPLNVVYGHSQLLLESEMSEDQKDQIKSIYRAAKAQSAIIEDLLDVSSIVSGKVKYNPRPVKLINAVDTALESVKMEAKNKGVELIYQDPHQCIIMGVKTRLVQIFWNLLSNAIKFTPEGGKVVIKSEVEEGFCTIKVMDTGKGIEPEFMPYIFEKFRQEEKASTRNRGGLGLGLSIASYLVKLHGGSIKAESEGKNKGATFTVSFPTVSLTARSGPKEEKEKLEEIERHDLHDVRILAVDDEPESLNLIARILRSYKANVITAENGEDALRKIKSERPDILISDIAMPKMDGYQLIKEVRQKEKAQGTHIPAIALTAFAQEEDKTRAINSGYEAYLSKPVSKDKLIGTVEQALH